MATLKRQKADGSWEYVQVIGNEIVGTVNRLDTTVSTHLADYASLLEGGEPVEMAIIASGWSGQVLVTKNKLGQVTITGRLQPPTTVGTSLIPLAYLPVECEPLTDISGMLFNTNNGKTYRSIFAVPAGVIRFINQDAIDTSKEYSFSLFYSTR